MAERAAGFLHCLTAHRRFWSLANIANAGDRFDLPWIFSRKQGTAAKLFDHDNGVADCIMG